MKKLVFLFIALFVGSIFFVIVEEKYSVDAAQTLTHEYGFQIYLDNRRINTSVSPPVPTGTRWGLDFSPFNNDSEMIDFLSSKGFTYSRVMIVMPNVLADGGFSQYTASDGKTYITHMKYWESKNIRTVLALRDYEYYTVSQRANMLLDMYRTSRQNGINPILSLGNEPDDKETFSSGNRYTLTEYHDVAALVIPTLKAEYPDLEWWGSGTADLGDFKIYLNAASPYFPTLNASHTYDGAKTDGSQALSDEVNNATANLGEINSGLWVMEEWTPFSTQYSFYSSQWNALRLEHFKRTIDNNCQIYIFWAANVNPSIIKNKTTLQDWVVNATNYAPTNNSNPVDTTPPVITNVVNKSITSSSAIINWTTSESATSIVRYGTTSGNYNLNSLDLTLTLSHSRLITGLNANIRYYYVVNSSDSNGNSAQSSENYFITTVIADITLPLVSVISPINKEYNSSLINFSITSNENSSAVMSFNSGVTNYTMQTQNNLNFNYSLNLNNGSYTVRFYVKDLNNNLNSSQTVSFSVNTSLPVQSDITPPQVIIISPTNMTYNSSVIYFNVSSNENSWGYFSLNNVNYYFSGNGSLLNKSLNLSDGRYTVRFYINDSSGNLNNSKIVSFNVNTSLIQNLTNNNSTSNETQNTTNTSGGNTGEGGGGSGNNRGSSGNSNKSISNSKNESLGVNNGGAKNNAVINSTPNENQLINNFSKKISPGQVLRLSVDWLLPGYFYIILCLSGREAIQVMCAYINGDSIPEPSTLGVWKPKEHMSGARTRFIRVNPPFLGIR